MRAAPPAVVALSACLEPLGWVSELWISGSLATDDYVEGVSDLDLVAVVSGPVDAVRRSTLVELHQELDLAEAAGADLGCVYVDEGSLRDPAALHFTWTHGYDVDRILSGVTRVELVRHGYTVLGRAPTELLPAVSDDEVRRAARDEVCGYWAWASRRPLMWRSPVIADLGLTSMARCRYAMRTGHLLTKSAAIEQTHAPAWLVEQLRARRRGETVVSPRLRTGWIAWRDARATVRAARRAP